MNYAARPNPENRKGRRRYAIAAAPQTKGQLCPIPIPIIREMATGEKALI